MGKKVERSKRILQGQNLERLVSQAKKCRSDLAGTRDSGLVSYKAGPFGLCLTFGKT